MASAKPFSARRLQAHGRTSVRVSLPKNELDEHGAARCEDVAAEYRPETERFIVDLEADPDDLDYQLSLGDVGNSLGVTIPAAIRHRHGLSPQDFVEVEPDSPEDGSVEVRL